MYKGKIGLIASKDRRLRKIPSKLCRSVKYHRKSATSPGFSILSRLEQAPSSFSSLPSSCCCRRGSSRRVVARSRSSVGPSCARRTLPSAIAASAPLLPLVGATASPRLPLPASRHRQRAEDQPREPQQLRHLVDGGPPASSGPGPPELGSPRCGPTNEPGRRLISLTPAASRGGGEAYRTPE